MALQNCPECGHQVFDAAVTCPNCGHPLKKEKRPLVSKPLGVVLQLAAAGLILFGIGSFLGESGDPTTPMLAIVIGFTLLLIGGRTKARLK